MTQLPPHLQPDSPDASSSTRVAGDRPFYKKKRYWIPAALIAVVLALPSDDQGADVVATEASLVGTTSRPGPSPSPSPTVDAAKLAAQKAAAGKAAADKAAAEKAAADKVAAEAAQAAAEKAAAEAVAAAAAEAQRVAAAEAARVEAARVEAERVAAAAAAAAVAAAAAPPPAPAAFYQNCTAVKAAGAAPIYPGDPGWQSKFDRDKDGVGCET